MCPLLRWASNRGRPPRCIRRGTSKTLPLNYSSTVRWLEAAQGRRSRVGDCVCFLFMMTTSRTTSLLHSVQGLLPRRTHDLRWVRLHPQLLGAHAAQGWTKLIENVDVALAHALAAPQLLAGE